MSYYIDVILPIPIQHLFTYSVNKHEAAFLKPGMRVAVPFGKSKVYTSIVFQVHNQAPNAYETKDIDQILDEQPIITQIQLNHWQWIASYYMCTLGEVVRAAVSRAFLLESETIVTLNTDKEIDISGLREEELLVYEALQMQNMLRIHEIQAIVDRKTVLPLIRRLVDRNILRVQEEVVEQYKPKLIRFVKLHSDYTSEVALKTLLEDLNRAPKQREVILTLFSISSQTRKPVQAEELLKLSGASTAILKSLLDKAIIEEFSIQKDRINYDGEAPKAIKGLSVPQKDAFEEVKNSFENHSVTLLHGVTSSGKTEIYVKLIEEYLNLGKQVLYMLPEIALTTQLVSRLQNYFGEKVSVYHSKYSLNERLEVWQNVLHNKPKAQIIIGARSSLFLPFANLGFVIIDEEHEPSFKQYSPAPRYHARDTAIVLANMHKANTLLGSATPSLESYYNAKDDKYGLVTLTERFGNVQMPLIELVNLKEKYHKKKMKGHFSETLLEAIQVALDAGEQIILFQNRRGYSPTVECKTCGHSPQCPNCDVTLTYHQHKNQLRCHYCGYHMAMQDECMACGSVELDAKGLGTEQIETELKSLFPKKRIARMDQDTTKGKNAYAKLIDALELGEIDILVGTQMLAKGLDFRNVSLVGVMNAESLLNFPDFRAHERSFQLLLQVAGRAGRTEKQGKVIIQTYNPEHPILQQVISYDYEAMYSKQMEERYNFSYPPYFRILKITIKDRKFNTMQIAANWFGEALKTMFAENILGPEQPPVGRIRNEYITNILVKIPKEQSLQKTKEIVRKIERKFLSIKEFRSVRLLLDVDNY